MINIIEKTYSLNGSLKKRSKTEEIILHHRAGNGDVESIDKLHKGNGWTCIGYQFYIRKDGSIYRGRREDSVGAHATNHNSKSIGICFEGNFENESMTATQINSGKELVSYLKDKYKITKVLAHRDVGKTACPGKNFPFSEIANGKVENVTHETISVNKPTIEYYPKCSSKYLSIVDGLKSIGVDSSYSFRKKIAQKNNVHDYIGSYSQNVSLLSKLKAGRLIKV